ncbi:imidazolonepropionase [Bradyrhizobium diversitatis]|uniref:Imidazolonepropionase n=1 Tax=Bradyrhizobium diversitatis TaxID=2755406 RepID=A0ABS0NUQ3_9BRAD|nr:imidazolonepropionase [Bradyrhizobium diversitatis]MBH5384739.1 imidazolonepropionase [Bradyrhizobium diversitatis]
MLTPKLSIRHSDQSFSDTPAELIIVGARQVVACDPTKADGIGVIENACVAVCGDTIAAIGTPKELTPFYGEVTQVVDADGGVVTPGLVDCHTHLIFAGDRSHEYFKRTEGLDDRGLTAAGVTWGVPASKARNAGLSVDDLVDASISRARTMLSCGTTTLETKSGYGLDHTSDIASLLAAKRIAERTGIEIVGTYLGAHARPTERADRYLDAMIRETIPAIAEKRLADFCDVYVDPDVFTLPECSRVLAAAADVGLGAKLHTDARINIGGARLAAEMRAASVDHGNMLSDDDLRILADAGTSVAFFPGFDWTVNHPRPVDGRRLVCSGVDVAIATDLCPVCWHLSQQMSMGFACRLSGLTAEQALLGVTLNAAKAIRRDDRIGSIAPGKQADLVVFDVPDYRQLAFRFGANSARWVIKKGKILVDGRAHAEGSTSNNDRKRR